MSNHNPLFKFQFSIFQNLKKKLKKTLVFVITKFLYRQPQPQKEPKKKPLFCLIPQSFYMRLQFMNTWPQTTKNQKKKKQSWKFWSSLTIRQSPKPTKTHVPFPSLKTKKKEHILCHFEKIIIQVAKFSQEK